MIVHNFEDSFTLIEQHFHAYLSKEILQQWEHIFLKDDPLKNSILYAIQNHDWGWKYFDNEPFWNDKESMPFSFTDFPLLPRIALYQNGVNEIELNDSYAAALCSAHYTKFLNNDTHEQVQKYLHTENLRRKRLLATFPHVSKTLFKIHLAMLQFADNISLYVCLNKPGTAKEDEHRFFKKGIPISQEINGIDTSLVNAYWMNKNTIALEGLPSIPAFFINLRYKNVGKQLIKELGLIKAYKSVPYQSIEIGLQVK